MNKITPLQLKKDQERRLLAGHLWIYSNEIDTNATPIKNLEPGQIVEIWGSHKRWLGMGYANPHSLICARILTRQHGVKFDQEFIQARIAQALFLRQHFYSDPYYRLIFGEADGLPGLVVDRYGDLLVTQFTTAGMERLQELVITALDTLIQPHSILLRNDIAIRELEGLPQQVSVLHSEIADWVEIQENGLKFLAAPKHGQKTGWFYDQAENRLRLQRYVKNKRVLDVFSYLGGWGVSAAAWGANAVLCLDSSDMALAGVLENAKLNHCQDRVRIQKGDAFELLKQLNAAGEKFDVVILDPPAFIKRRKDLASGLTAYHQLNRLGLRLLSPNGILISSSCSSLLTQEALLHTVQKAARSNSQGLQLLELGQQRLDHPIHPAIVETAYLKTMYFRVINDF